jgi:hypothetical protein
MHNKAKRYCLIQFPLPTALFQIARLTSAPALLKYASQISSRRCRQTKKFRKNRAAAADTRKSLEKIGPPPQIETSAYSSRCDVIYQ